MIKLPLRFKGLRNFREEMPRRSVGATSRYLSINLLSLIETSEVGRYLFGLITQVLPSALILATVLRLRIESGA